MDLIQSTCHRRSFTSRPALPGCRSLVPSGPTAIRAPTPVSAATVSASATPAGPARTAVCSATVPADAATESCARATANVLDASVTAMLAGRGRTARCPIAPTTAVTTARAWRESASVTLDGRAPIVREIRTRMHALLTEAIANVLERDSAVQESANVSLDGRELPARCCSAPDGPTNVLDKEVVSTAFASATLSGLASGVISRHVPSRTI